MNNHEPRYYIWGTGERAKKINQMHADVLKRSDVAGYIDNDSQKWGKMFFGKPIFSPEILKEEGEKNIIISCACYKDND